MFFFCGPLSDQAKRNLTAVSLAGRYLPDTVCRLDKDRHPIVLRIFVVNIMGSMSFFHVFIRCY